jgi:hypothetical protein
MRALSAWKYSKYCEGIVVSVCQDRPHPRHRHLLKPLVNLEWREPRMTIQPLCHDPGMFNGYWFVVLRK